MSEGSLSAGPGSARNIDMCMAFIKFVKTVSFKRFCGRLLVEKEPFEAVDVVSAVNGFIFLQQQVKA